MAGAGTNTRVQAIIGGTVTKIDLVTSTKDEVHPGFEYVGEGRYFSINQTPSTDPKNYHFWKKVETVKPKCTCNVHQACEQCYNDKYIPEGVWDSIREIFKKEEITTLQVKNKCDNCGSSKDIRVKPITYDCMECGATWTDKRDLPNPLLKNLLKKAEAKLDHNKVQMQEKDETIERLKKELAAKK